MRTIRIFASCCPREQLAYAMVGLGSSIVPLIEEEALLRAIVDYVNSISGWHLGWFGLMFMGTSSLLCLLDVLLVQELGWRKAFSFLEKRRGEIGWCVVASWCGLCFASAQYRSFAPWLIYLPLIVLFTSSLIVDATRRRAEDAARIAAETADS